jgi:nitrite reductase/ring-hydroxylating ferredoxin subunit
MVSELSELDPLAPLGAILPATVDGAQVAVIHTKAGWVMVEDVCPHASCAFTDDGEVVDGTTLICNCHGSEFDLQSGDLLRGPALDPLRIRALLVDDGQLRRADR